MLENAKNQDSEVSLAKSCDRKAANHQQKLDEVTSKQDTGLYSYAVFIATKKLHTSCAELHIIEYKC